MKISVLIILGVLTFSSSFAAFFEAIKGEYVEVTTPTSPLNNFRFPKFSQVRPNSANRNSTKFDHIPTHEYIPGGLEFTCKGRVPGYYSDPSPISKCQVYHMCMQDGRKYSMLCGVGTIFNQITFVCDHWYNYRCEDAELDYQRNIDKWDQFLFPLLNFSEETEIPDYGDLKVVTSRTEIIS